MKQLLSGILVSTMILSTVSASLAANTEGLDAMIPQSTQTLASGSCGVSATWNFNESTGVLTISGSGAMNNYEYFDTYSNSNPNATPWYQYTEQVKTLIVEEGITTISDYAFDGFRNTASVTLPSSLKSIGDYAFRSCVSLTEITFPEGLEEIGENAFQFNTSFTSLEIPGGVKELINCFQGCKNLKSVTLHEGIEFLLGTFKSCSALETIHFPSSVYYVGGNTLGQCNSLTSIYMPDTVTTLPSSFTNAGSIVSGPFDMCDNLSSIRVSESVEALICSNNPSLHAIYVPSNVTSMSLRNNGEGDFTIYGEKGSAAEEYAGIHSIKFVEGYAPNMASPTVANTSTSPNPSTPTAPETSGYPSWATTFIDFVAPEIMPDISVDNYNDACTRGLIAQSLYNLCGNGEILSSNTVFNDVGPYGTAISWCDQKGVMVGTGDNTFGTYGNVTREQFAIVLFGTMGMVLYEDFRVDTTAVDGFADQEEISDWARIAMSWAVESGLIAGTDGKLNPQGNVTRTEAAVMLKKFTERGN